MEADHEAAHRDSGTSLLGPEHTFKTTVVSPQPGQIILVGGGDPYLARKASADYPRRGTISGLARTTARRLKQDKIKKVSLGYDASLFTGPAWNPRWPSFYRAQSHRPPLVIDDGRVGASSPNPRYQDPAKERPLPSRRCPPGDQGHCHSADAGAEIGARHCRGCLDAPGADC